MKRALILLSLCATLYFGHVRAETPSCAVERLASSNTDFVLCVDIASMGGYREGTIYDRDKKVHQVDDLTGYVWITENDIAYSVSPIYGEPGIFLFNAKTRSKIQLVCPMTKIQGYPNGADYFVLSGYDGANKGLSYLYSPNVDLLGKAQPETRTISIKTRDRSCLSESLR